MPSLSSLIVQRHVATVLEVEQAIARQVIHGGDLVTNLLEVAPQCEPGLNAVLGESVGLPPAPWGRLAAPDSDVLDLIPAELCLAHGFFPLRGDRQSIVIATPTPLSPSVEDTLRFSLSRGLTQIAAPAIRVREGIAAHYGIPLDARQLKLVQKLDEAARARGRMMSSRPPEPGEETAPLSLPRPPSVIPSTFESGVPSEEPAPSGWGIGRVVVADPVAEVVDPRAVDEGWGGSEDTSDEAPSDDAAGHDAAGHDAAEHDAAEHDAAEHDAAEHDVAEHDVAEHDVAEHEAAIGPSREASRDVPVEAARAADGRADDARGAHPERHEGEDDARAAIVPPVVEVTPSPGPAREIYPPRSPVVPRSEPPPSLAQKPTLFDPIAQQRADAMGDPSSRRFDAEPWADRPMRDTVPTPMDAVDAMEAALLGPSGRPDPLHPDSLTRRAPDVISFDEPAPSTEPEEPAEAFVSEPPPPAERFEPAEPKPEPAPTRAAPAPAEPAPAAPTPAEPFEDSPPPPSTVNAKALHRLLRRELLDKKRGRSARRKGPFARSDAEKELEGATSPEELVDVFFAFVSQFFEYSAMFLLHGDLAEGRDAFGPGADRDKVLGIGVPLDLPSSFSRARAEGVLVLTRMNESDLDAELRRDLGRDKAARPSQVAIVPVALRGRAVALLYGDDGATDVTVAQLGDLLGFSALASKNLERIAVLKKRGQVPSKKRPEPGNVAALARAFSLPGADADHDARPVTGVSPGARSVAPPNPDDLPPHERFSPTGRADAYAETTLARSREAEPPEARTGSTRPSADAATGPRDVTRRYDDEAFEPGRAAFVHVAPPSASDLDASTLLGTGPSSEPDRRVVEVPSHGYAPYDSPHDRPFGAPPVVRVGAQRSPSSPPLRREEDDDASSFIAEQLGTPHPPRTHARRAEYAIIPDRAGGSADGAEAARAREAAIYGPYGPLLMKATLGGIQAEEALAELAREAEHSLPKLVAAFPGPLLVDRLRLRDQLPPASECGPLLKLLVMLRRHSLGFMTVRSTSPDVEQRFWATHVLGELTYPEASPAVLPRLFDDDVMVRRVARRAATSLVGAGAAGEPLRTSLENMIKTTDEPIHRRVLAIEAMGEIRSGLLIPSLIGALDDPSEEVVEAARCSLMLIARQDLGVSSRSWDAWWLLNRNRHRIEWLIDALTHDAASVRRAAGDELKQLTKEYFGYYDDLPPRDRERAQQKYREWWNDEGQFRHR